MPLPTISQVHVDRPLTNVSIAYIADEGVYAASRVFPDVPVKKQSDLYFVYDKDFWYRSEMDKRAPHTESAGGGWKQSTDSYRADVWSLHKDISEEERDNADEPLDPDVDATEYLTQQYLIRKDKDWSAEHFVVGKWGTDLTGVTPGPPTAGEFLRWDDAGSTPIEDIRGERTAIAGATGFRPNKLVLGAEVWTVLEDHPDIVDRIKAGQTPGGPAVTMEVGLAQILGLDEIVVAWSVETTTKQGAAIQVTEFILGKNALLVYVNPAPSIRKPSGGYTFKWAGLKRGTGGLRIKNFPMFNLNSDRVEIDAAWDHKLVGADLGTLFLTAVN